MRTWRDLQTLIHKPVRLLGADGAEAGRSGETIRAGLQREIGTAAVIDPNPAIIEAPGIPLRAGRTAALVHHLHLHPAAGLGVAVATLTVIGGAVKRLDEACGVVAVAIPVAVAVIPVASFQGEVGAAAVIDPDAAIIEAPRISLSTRGPAALADHLYSCAGFCLAVVTLTVIGGAVKRLDETCGVVAVVPVTTTWRTHLQGKVGTATAIDPDAATIEAPSLALDAARPAALPDELNSGAGVNFTIVAPAVIRRAGRNLRVRWRRRLQTKVGAAAVIDPDATVVEAPGISLRAGRAAALMKQLNPLTGIGVAAVALAVVGRAR
jgi:hypothetical protein